MRKKRKKTKRGAEGKERKKMLFLVIAFYLTVTALASSTDTIVIQLKPSAGNPTAFAKAHGLKHVRSLDDILGAKGYHEFSGLLRAKRDIHATLEAHDDVEWSAPQVQHQQKTRSGELGRSGPVDISDPLFGRQWHLHATVVGLDVKGALGQDVDGRGVTIAIVDDGIESSHHDLAPNLSINLSRDFNGNQGTDPSPWEGDSHGTSAAGCCCAKRNDVCGLGVASGATLAGYRLIAAGTSDLDEAEGLSLHKDVVDIYSCSWGPPDDGARLEGPGRLLKEVFEQGVRTGRGGKGNIFVWAGGNGAERNDNCNYDGYANDFRTISVSAYDGNGRAAWYSERCAMHFISAPSSGMYTPGVITATTHDKCTEHFGGTSAAAPMMAGVIANMLQVNPALSWRDVQGVLAKSAIPLRAEYDDWSLNRRGYRHSHAFGFGRVNLPITLDVARNWKHMPAMRVCTTGRKMVTTRIPVGSNGYGSLVIPTIVSPANDCIKGITFVESVGLTMHVRHPRRGQVVVNLQSPEGVISKLAEVHPDTTANYPSEGWEFNTVRHWGEQAVGTWQIMVGDHGGGHGVLTWYELTIRGHVSAV